MSARESITNDFAGLLADAKVFVGEFVYAPFGIEASETVNTVTLYAALAVVGFVIYRLVKPAPAPRYRTPVRDYDFGRGR